MTENQNIKNEPLPIDENFAVKEYENIYKTSKWWCAVVLVNAFGHDKVMVYLWQWKEKKRNEGGKWVGTGQFSWKVQQKMGINFQENWDHEKAVVDRYMAKIKGVST